MKRLIRRLRGLLPWMGFLLLLLEPAVAFARAGGGQSYSGGGHGSGGGGGDGGLIWLLVRLWIWLLFNHPVIGVPLTIVLIYAFVQYQKRHATAKGQTWDSAPPKEPPSPQASRDLDDLRTLDPEFSVVLFEDFAYALYARAHEARSSERDLEALSPYLSSAARGHLAQRLPVGAPVSNVVVGAMRVVALSIPPTANATPGGPPPRVVVTLEFEANMTVGMSGAEHTHYVEERWRLERDATVQ
ncbi:MAG TPA: hypothetical protein VFR03_13555, partial [Thermoanaerobaculia bacterium]|nr:hypothetical protein [Thermoanaerobaculia bacterium]